MENLGWWTLSTDHWKVHRKLSGNLATLTRDEQYLTKFLVSLDSKLILYKAPLSIVHHVLSTSNAHYTQFNIFNTVPRSQIFRSFITPVISYYHRSINFSLFFFWNLIDPLIPLPHSPLSTAHLYNLLSFFLLFNSLHSLIYYIYSGGV